MYPFCFLLVTSISFVSSAAADDVTCLRGFKSAVSDPDSHLSSWNFSHSSPGFICAFAGVECWHPGENRISGLSLHSFSLTGPIPPALSLCTSLTGLDLSGNQLSGPIPPSLCSWLPYLTSLSLSSSSLYGPIPPSLSNCTHLNFLDLSHNRLSGPIPDTLSRLERLTHLDLSHNQLSGRIPPGLSNCTYLDFLDLSHNRLSGPIPDTLSHFKGLTKLDLSHNQLSGRIPEAIRSRFNLSAFANNPGLCTGRCSKSISKTVLIIIITVGVLGAVVSLVIIYAFYSKRKFKILSDTNVPHLDHHRVVSHYELVRATENFSEENLVGRGGFGSVFRGCLDDGLVVAIKVLNLDVEASLKSFEAECKVLRMVRHKNLIKIISVCSNLDFKALILEYMPNGSLERWLHSGTYYLNLLQRLNIMVDVSLALEYLHYHHPQVVLHCDLKPSNILLDEDLSAHVGDFGIAKQLLGDSKSSLTASMPGTIGYIAPEYATTATVSRMCDVYSFGILLLETLTGKKPVDSMFGEQLSLREWICKANTIMDIVDKNILKYHGTDNDLRRPLQCLSSAFELGLLCSKHSPKERIPMTDVVVRLQKIKIEYMSS